MNEIVWVDEDNELPLTGGGFGQPGCSCGMYDAVVKVDGEYLCAAEAAARGLQRPATAGT